MIPTNLVHIVAGPGTWDRKLQKIIEKSNNPTCLREMLLESHPNLPGSCSEAGGSKTVHPRRHHHRLRAGPPCSRILNGAPIWTERLVIAGDDQLKLCPFRDYLKHAPANYVLSEIPFEERTLEFDFSHVLTLPFADLALPISQDCLCCFSLSGLLMLVVFLSCAVC